MAFFFGKEDHEDCDCSEDGEEECENRREIHCRLSDPCYDLYCGIVDTHIGPIGGSGTTPRSSSDSAPGLKRLNTSSCSAAIRVAYDLSYQ